MWSHTLPFGRSAYPNHKADAGPIVTAGGDTLLIRSLTACDDLGNCAQEWSRPEIVALDTRTGAVRWATAAMDAPTRTHAKVPQRSWLGVRLLPTAGVLAVIEAGMTYADANRIAVYAVTR